MIVAMHRAMNDLWTRFSGLDEAAKQPLLAAQSDHDIAVWTESKQRSWTVNTMVLTTIRNGLHYEGPTHEPDP